MKREHNKPDARDGLQPRVIRSVRAQENMTITRTAEESRAHYIERMGEPLGGVYSCLWQELAWLYSKWNEFKTLFGTKRSRIDLLNNAAPHFFRVIQDSLWEDTILHIARLTDPPKSVGKDNLSVQLLPALVSDTTLSAELERLIDAAKEASEFCRDWRNRRLAHRDLDLALGDAAVALKAGSREKVGKALDALAKILDAVSTHYLDSSTMFDMGGNIGGGDCLLRIIHDGLKAEENLMERIREGNILPDDFNHPDL